VSLECGPLHQDEIGQGRYGRHVRAKGGVYITVYVDDLPAYPGEVKFCEREQTLTTCWGASWLEMLYRMSTLS